MNRGTHWTQILEGHMARRSRNNFQSKVAKYLTKLRDVKNAEAEVQKSKRELDLKIEKLKKRIEDIPHFPHLAGPGGAGSRKR